MGIADYFEIVGPYGEGEEQFRIDLSCAHLIDYYDYHDASSDIDIFCARADLVELRNKLTEAIAREK
jgi:hypothetical protein